MNEVQPHRRHWSRRLVLQALYQWQLGGHGVDELLEQYAGDENWGKVDKDYFTELLRESINHADELAKAFSAYAQLPAGGRLDPVERAILLYATYEMLHREDTPTKVVITEAVKLCKKFGTLEGYKFINGVLDKLAEHRAVFDRVSR